MNSLAAVIERFTRTPARVAAERAEERRALESTYRHAKEGARNCRRLRGWEGVRRTLVATALQVRRELRAVAP